MNINGIAHIALNVSDLKKSKLFYDKILTDMGLTLIHSSNKSFYYVGGKTGILIQQANADKIKNLKFSQDNLGLHHFCFRMRSKEDVEKFYFLLKKIKANIIRGPMNGNWVKGYYYIVFEDPDGIRLEVNYVPNKGIFEKNGKFNSSGDY